MKNRTVPFGYMLSGGKLQLHPQEAESVLQIFQAYSQGQSLKRIADTLREKCTEYLPGMCGWNKNRVSRIIRDSRYCGENGFPAIISPEAFAAANEIVKARNTQKNYVLEETISPATVAMTCGCCGEPVSRRTDRRTAYKQKFCCDHCGADYPMASEALNDMIIDLLKHVSLQLPIPSGKPLTVMRIENKIERLLESGNTDPSEVRRQVFDLAAEKYRHLSAGLETLDKLRTALAPANLSSSNIRKIVMETVKQITLMDHERIEITLINDQVLRKEQPNGSDSAEENRPRNQTDDIAGAAESVA